VAYQQPPCPRVDHGCPQDGWTRDGWPRRDERRREQDYAETAPPAPPAPPAEEWDRRHDVAVTHGGYVYDRTESRSDSGWTYSETDGQGAYQSWNDTPPPTREHREAYWDGRDGAGPPPCPPQAAAGCGGDPPADPPPRRDPPPGYADGPGQWQDGSYGQVYTVSGRDAQGYLVWPGKAPQ
jgi:hypothetical protein